MGGNYETQTCSSIIPLYTKQGRSMKILFSKVGVEELDGLHKALTSTLLNAVGINWNTNFAPGLVKHLPLVLLLNMRILTTTFQNLVENLQSGCC